MKSVHLYGYSSCHGWPQDLSGINMKFKTALLIAALVSSPMLVHANGLHLSPEVKIGAYHGFGLQAGVTDVADLNAVYLSYSNLWYDSNNYDESVDAYRVGIQNMLGHNQTHGFQAEVGFANYDGERIRSGETQKKTATGFSLGGAYVYQATSMLSLRAGFDMNIFDHNKTYIPYDTTVNVNLGAIFSF